MQKKFSLAALAFLALPISHAGATPTHGSLPVGEDTIIVDRNELIDVLRGVAASEMRRWHRSARSSSQYESAKGYRPYQQGETMPVYNTVSKQVEYIPVYVPRYTRQQPYLPYESVQNSLSKSAKDNESKQTERLQKQIDELQKQIETLGKTVQDPAIKQQMSSLADRLNTIRAEKDTVAISNALAENESANAIEQQSDESAQVSKTVLFDTNILQVFFEISSNQLTNEATRTLKTVAGMLKENRNLKVELTGFSSKDGPKAFNRNLAMRRMKSVKDFLLHNGVKAHQISTMSYGIDKKSDMSTYARRVELCISL